MKHRRGRLLVALLTAVALVVAACGGDDDTTAGDDTEITTTTVGEPTGPPLNVHLINNTEGGPASWPDRISAIQAAADAVNTRGGIQGRPLVVKLCDHKFDTNATLECGREAAASDSVALVGLFCVVGDQMAAIFDEAKLPEIGTHTCLYSEPRAMSLANAASPGGGATFNLYKELGATKYVVLRDTSLQPATSQTTIDRVVEAGLQWGGDVTVDTQTPDWGPTAQALKDTGAEVLGIGIITNQLAVRLIPAMDAIGYKPKLVGASGYYDDQTFAAIGESFDERLYSIIGHLPPNYTDNDEIVRFQEEMDEGQRAGYPTLDERTSGHLAGWLAIQMFEKLANTVDGEITRESLNATAQTLEDVDMGGVTAPWNPVLDEDPDTEGRQQYNDYFVVVYKHGEGEVLWKDEAFCGHPDGC